MTLQLPEHGTLIQYQRCGAYLIGNSGVGKTEAALSMIHQGATLICDDAPELTTGKDRNELLGVCPEGFYGLMHLRDLGVINIIDLLGQQAFSQSHPIHLVIELVHSQNTNALPAQLVPEYLVWQYQHWKIPGIRLHLYKGRDPSVLIKTSIMQFNKKNKIRNKLQ